MKKTTLQQALAKIAPYVSIHTHWEHDHDSGPISKECDGFSEDEDDGWQAWQSEITATAVIDGEDKTGRAYLGGTFEKVDDLPEESNPEISGYENQMTQEALQELRGQVESDDLLTGQIDAALAYLEKKSQEEYEA